MKFSDENVKYITNFFYKNTKKQKGFQFSSFLGYMHIFNT